MKRKTVQMMVLLALTWPSLALAKDTRREVLQSCVQQAKDHSFTGDAHAEFMRGCLKLPDDAKPIAFASSAPQQLAPGKTIQPMMLQPFRTDKKPN